MEYLIIPIVGVFVYKKSRKSHALNSFIASKLQNFKLYSIIKEIKYDFNEFKINNLAENTEYYKSTINQIKSDQNDLKQTESKVVRVLDFENIAYDISLIGVGTDEEIGGNSTCDLDYNLMNGSCK